MDNKEVMNKCLKTFITVIAAVVVFFLFVYPNISNNKETFSGEEEQKPSAVEQKVSVVEQNNEPLDSSLEELDLQQENGLGDNLPVEVEGPSGESPESVNASPEGDEKPVKLPEDYYFLDDGSSGKMSIQHNLCSKSCCSEQYPTPFKLQYDGDVCLNKDKYVPSQIMCNNPYQDSGCLCMTHDQAQFLTNRGNNGRFLQ